MDDKKASPILPTAYRLLAPDFKSIDELRAEHGLPPLPSIKSRSIPYEEEEFKLPKPGSFSPPAYPQDLHKDEPTAFLKAMEELP